MTFALCSANDSQHVSVSVESRSGVPGSPGGLKMQRIVSKILFFYVFFFLFILCLDVVLASCMCFTWISKAHKQKNAWISLFNMVVDVQYLGQEDGKLGCSDCNPLKNSKLNWERKCELCVLHGLDVWKNDRETVLDFELDTYNY